MITACHIKVYNNEMTMTKKLTIIGLTVGQKFTLQLNTIINYIPKSMDEENI